MTAVFVAMVLAAAAGVGVASVLAAYAQRRWTQRPVRSDGDLVA